MPYQVSRTDTGQFVLLDPATDTVVIDDDLAQGFAKLEQALASKPAHAPSTAAHERTTQGSSAFEFRGGPRYTPILLAVVLPFAWLLVLYLALANLLSEVTVDRSAREQTEARLDELEHELQALRSEVINAPRTAKTKPPRPKGGKQPSEPAVEPDPDATPDEPAPPTSDASNGPS